MSSNFVCPRCGQALQLDLAVVPDRLGRPCHASCEEPADETEELLVGGLFLGALFAPPKARKYFTAGLGAIFAQQMREEVEDIERNIRSRLRESRDALEVWESEGGRVSS